ncbi:hypothetical protein AAF712_009164 [Marasmius tenuissimus]|uniref:Uncharacterized protein n=1 Tax=Marasmius tenuissimus TaxID=585030 RepID=A0ABR2ZR96_9AGAR
MSRAQSLECSAKLGQPELPSQPRKTITASSSSVTEDIGDFIRTLNGSHVYKSCIHVERAPAAPDTDLILSSSQTHSLPDKQRFVSSVSDAPASIPSPETQTATDQMIDYTLSQRYGSLLSTGCSGYAGKEHIISIGDVGVCHDTDPFHTFFNITKARGGLSRIRPPNGVDLPCIIDGDDVTVDSKFYEEYRLLAKPKASILKRSLVSVHRTMVYTFKLSAKSGALLLLPRGAVL